MNAKTDLVTHNAMADLASHFSGGPRPSEDVRSRISINWTIRRGEIASLRILRRRTDKKGATDIVYAKVKFRATEFLFQGGDVVYANQDDLLSWKWFLGDGRDLLYAEGDLILLYGLYNNGWHLDSVDAASELRVLDYSADAVRNLWGLNTAEVTYATSYNLGYSPSLNSLGRAGCAQPSQKCAGLVDDELASGTKGGYRFTYVPDRPNTYGWVETYTINADPEAPEDMGSDHFFSDQSGVTHKESGGPAGPKSPDLSGADQRVPVAQPEQPAQTSELTPEEGEPIDYSLFYAKAKSTGLPIGKRFRFGATVTHELTLYGDGGVGDKPLGGQAAFDDEAQHERFLQRPDYQTHTIVASMGDNGRINIHRIE